MKRVLNLLILILLLTLNPQSLSYAETPVLNETNADSATFQFNQKNFSYPGIGTFYIRKIDFKVSNQKYRTSFSFPGSTGTLTYFDDSGSLITKPLYNGFLPLGKVLHIKTDSYHMILGQGYTYRDLGNGTIENLGSDAIHIKKADGKWIVTYTYSARKNSFGILWGLNANKELIDYSNPTQVKIWSGYDLDRSARLSIDGYYYKSPSTYRPATQASYWRIPNSYITNSLIKNKSNLAADLLGNGLLMIAKDTVNEAGFIPTLPASTWLKSDYNIGPGFFDTRFNSDTIETYLIAYQKYKDPVYRDVYLKMSDFYLQHGQNCHRSVFGSSNIEGWLIDDYWNEKYSRTHTSLNHQLQAIHLFLNLYKEERNLGYLDFANKMLFGIKNTRDRWIMKNNNLEYAMKPDGSMGFIDYPYLTYNDLYNVQKDLESINGERDPDLDILAAAKKTWMDANGITDYRK